MEDEEHRRTATTVRTKYCSIKVASSTRPSFVPSQVCTLSFRAVINFDYFMLVQEWPQTVCQVCSCNAYFLGDCGMHIFHRQLRLVKGAKFLSTPQAGASMVYGELCVVRWWHYYSIHQAYTDGNRRPKLL